MSVLYMYYDVIDDGERSLKIWGDDEYDEQMKLCCLMPIS